METNQEVTSQVAKVQQNLELLNLEDKLSIKQLAEKINEIVAKLNETSGAKVRDRGPASEKVMTEEDARTIMLGELKDASHKDCATKLGLSYGQVYSARKGFTFKPIYKEMMNLATK